MADTIRTQSYILSNLFQDGQTGGISAQDLRDYVVSAEGCYADMFINEGTPVVVNNIGALNPSKVTVWNNTTASSGVTVDHTTDNDFTIQTGADGIYKVDISLSFTGTASKTFVFNVFKTGSGTDLITGIPTDGSGSRVIATITGLISLVATDTLDLRVIADSGTTNQIQVNYGSFNIMRLK